MDTLKVMVNGLPGNVAGVVARQVINDSRFDLMGNSLTGPKISETEYRIGDAAIRLIHPDARGQAINEIKASEGPFISVDYTHPTAVNGNAEFYCKYGLPFVMGTTGGDRQLLAETVAASYRS